MRALALMDDSARLARARARAEARSSPWPFAAAPSTRRRIETDELRRCRDRDAVLLMGRDPAVWPTAAPALEHLPIAGDDRFRLLD